MRQFQYTQEMIDRINVYSDFDTLQRYDFSTKEDKQCARDLAVSAHMSPGTVYWRKMAVMILDALAYIEYLEGQNLEIHMSRLNDVTCQECGRTLHYQGQIKYPDGRVVQEWFCLCGYEKEVVIKKGKDEK